MRRRETERRADAPNRRSRTRRPAFPHQRQRAPGPARSGDLSPRHAAHFIKRSAGRSRAHSAGRIFGGYGERRRGLREPACGAQHEQGPGAAPVLSDLLCSQPCAQRWALPSGLRPAPKGGLATGQPECNGRATRRETPLLERPAYAVSAQRPRCGDVASALGAAPRRERRRQPSTGLAVAAISAR